MEEEFSLDEEIIKASEDMAQLGLDNDILEIQDVKKFIQILKEKDDMLVEKVGDIVFEMRPKAQDANWDFTSCVRTVIKIYKEEFEKKLDKHTGKGLIDVQAHKGVKE